MNASPHTPWLLFDGQCRFCNAWVRFVLRWERAAECRFVPLQSPAARELLQPFARDPGALDSIYLIEDGVISDRSTAALKLAGKLRRPWRWLSVLQRVPMRWRDAVYDLVGRWRYRLFGQSPYCAAARPQDAARFVTEFSPESPCDRP